MDSKLNSQFRRQLGSYIRSSTDFRLVTQKPHFYRHVPKETKHANPHRKQAHCHSTAALLKISKYRNNCVVSQKSMECFYPWAYQGMKYTQHRWMPETSCRVNKQTQCQYCASPTELGCHGPQGLSPETGVLGYFSIPVVSCCAPSSEFTGLSL